MKIHLSDFGLNPDTRTNAVPSLLKALEANRSAEKPHLVFKRGRYDFWPFQQAESLTGYCEEATLVPIERLKDLVIDGDGSDFVFHGWTQPFTVAECDNVTFANFTIDWDIPLVAQAEVVRVAGKFIDIKIDTVECPYVVEGGKLFFVGEGWKAEAQSPVMEYDKKTRIVALDTGDVPCLGRGWEKRYRAEEIEPDTVRLHNSFARLPAQGSMLVIEHLGRRYSAFSVFESKDIEWRDITIYHCGGAGVGATYCENLTFRRYNCVPNEKKNRYLAQDADGIHLNGIRGSVSLEECRFSGIMDDPFNIHSMYVPVAERIDDRTFKCTYAWSKKYDWAGPGDICAFVENKQMHTIAEGTVESFERDPDGTFTIRFEKPAPSAVKSGFALENMSCYGDVNIRNNYFGNCRARGVLVSTPGKVTIENNVFESSGCAILIPGEANYWFESGAVKDVLIKNNTFNDPCLTSIYQFSEAVISIYPEIPNLTQESPPYHRNIRIEGNQFHPFDYPVLHAKSVDGITFRNNSLVRSHRFPAYHRRHATLSFEACRNVDVDGTKIEGDLLGKNITIEKMTPEWIRVGENEPLTLES